MTELTELSLSAFAAELGSRAPTPGGGGAAALCGALAAALAAMAARLSENAEKPALPALIERADAQCAALLSLIDRDAADFAPLSAAYRIPKDAPGRRETIRVSTLLACRAPLEMLRSAAATAELLVELRPLCKALLLSDLGCAAQLCRAAMECAAMNLFVNTRTLPDEGEAQAMAAEAEALLARWVPVCETLGQTVLDTLRGVSAHG